MTRITYRLRTQTDIHYPDRLPDATRLDLEAWASGNTASPEYGATTLFLHQQIAQARDPAGMVASIVRSVLTSLFFDGVHWRFTDEVRIAIDTWEIVREVLKRAGVEEA